MILGSSPAQQNNAQPRQIRKEATVGPPRSAPSFSSAELGPSLLERFRSSLDIEEMLGTDWLKKLGIVLLVLGIAFSRLSATDHGARRQGFGGFVTAAVMLGAGISGEREDRYRILARAGVGGDGRFCSSRHTRCTTVSGGDVLDSQPLRSSGGDACRSPPRWCFTRCGTAPRSLPDWRSLSRFHSNRQPFECL